MLWSSIGAALVLSCLRHGGQQAAAALVRESSRRSALAFLQTTRVGGSAPGPARAAATQRALDHHLGRHTRLWCDAQGRHWLDTHGLHWIGTAPQAGAMCPAALSAAVGDALWQGSHATVAVMRGASDTVFVSTLNLTRGDPCDRGCFTASNAAPLVGDTGEPSLPAPGDLAPAPGFGDGLPADALLRMLVLCEQHGVVGGAAQVEHAWRIVLTAFWRWLPGELGLPDVSDPQGAALLYAAFWALLGDETVLHHESDRTWVEHRHQRLWAEQTDVPVPLVEAIVRGWSTALAHCDFHLRCRITALHTAPQLTMTLCFDAAGPE
jgi:hypothetical protein